MSTKSGDASYYPGLDALRAVGFLYVYSQHFFYKTADPLRGRTPLLDRTVHFLLENGDLILQMFFVMSGFLITHLLIREQFRTGKIDIKAFYVRRILRIWPLYYFTLVMVALLFHETPQFQRPDSVLRYLTFLVNFDALKYSSLGDLTVGVLWSLSVEEQFYLVWPVLLWLFPLTRQWVGPTLVLVAGLFFRDYFFRSGPDHWLALHWHTAALMGDMAVGALMAYAWAFWPRMRQIAASQGPAFWCIPYVLMFITVFWRDGLEHLPGGFVYCRLVWGSLWVWILTEQCFAERPLLRTGRWRWAVYTGKFTFGLYVLHPTAHHFADLLINNDLHLPHQADLEALLGLPLTFAMAWLSYYYLEMPFLRLKKRFTVVKSRD
jgi:peptidoglycan/LPS O-acetylase OafA/YrhL